ncbi:MAG: AbrB/MazE/SpoVT family DNA-binding domain-containing protein [Nanoarchaeota archaeon]
MIISKTRKWGSSLGVIIPKEVVKGLKLKENQDVVIDIKPKENPLKELFGMGAGKTNKSTEELLKEVRGKESKFF